MHHMAVFKFNMVSWQSENRNFNIDESNELEQTQQDDINSITMSFSGDDHDDDSAQSGNEGTTASIQRKREVKLRESFTELQGTVSSTIHLGLKSIQ